MDRRTFINRLLVAGGLGTGSAITFNSTLAAGNNLSGYKALVSIHLNGGCDGNDVLVPTDSAYADYAKSRPNVALKKDALTPLSGSFLGHTMGLNPALKSLVPLFNSGKLGALVNVGPLVKPTTSQEVLAGTAKLPPFLYSHPEQTALVNGWMGDQDPSGWGGRAMESLDPSSVFKSPLLSINNNQSTLVLGQRSKIITASSYPSTNIGRANLLDPKNQWTQILDSLSRFQSPNQVSAEYARTFKGIFADAQELALAAQKVSEPSGFGSSSISRQLAMVSRLLSYYKTTGATRQIYSLQWGSFDTHTNQRGVSDLPLGQDTQLSDLAEALVSFQAALDQGGLSNDVALLVTTEFGRTLGEASGLGSDHAWGNHWLVMGNAIKGAQMYGSKFPSLVLGGADDAHPQKRGYWVPQISSDQVAADFLTWLGLPSSALTAVLPNLSNFAFKTVGFMNA
jgi:uncharacterized protein (DUF1501 family)